MSEPRTLSPEHDVSSMADADMRTHSWCDTLAAFVGFALVDLVVTLRGYPLLYRLVRRWRVAPGREPNSRDLIRVNAAVEHAAVYYPRRALCLSRSAVTTCLLRRRGVPAQLVIGARKIPFHAHAWVEVGDRVVNDAPAVKSRYPELDRF